MRSGPRPVNFQDFGNFRTTWGIAWRCANWLNYLVFGKRNSLVRNCTEFLCQRQTSLDWIFQEQLPVRTVISAEPWVRGGLARSRLEVILRAHDSAREIGYAASYLLWLRPSIDLKPALVWNVRSSARDCSTGTYFKNETRVGRKEKEFWKYRTILWRAQQSGFVRTNHEGDENGLGRKL